MKNIYFAGSYARREELAGYAEELRRVSYEDGLGLVITSRWLYEDVDTEDDGIHSPPDYHAATLSSLKDCYDLFTSDTLIAFTEFPDSKYGRGGRHVEAGMALARNIPIYVIGPRENIFYCSSGIRQFDHWNEFIVELRYGQIAGVGG